MCTVINSHKWITQCLFKNHQRQNIICRPPYKTCYIGALKEHRVLYTE